MVICLFVQWLVPALQTNNSVVVPENRFQSSEYSFRQIQEVLSSLDEVQDMDSIYTSIPAHTSYSIHSQEASCTNCQLEAFFSRPLLNFHVFAFPCERPINTTLAKRNLKDFDWFRGTRMENTLSWVLGKTFCILHSSFTSIYCCTSQKIPVASPALINWSIPSGDH